MRRIRAVLLPLLVGTALVLAACNEGDITSVPEASGQFPLNCGTPASFSLRSGSAPTVNADGSLTFTAKGVVTMSTTLSGSVAFGCVDAILGGVGSNVAYFLYSTGGSGSFVKATYLGNHRVEVNIVEDNSGVPCPPRTFTSESFVNGGLVSLYSVTDQTGAYPVISLWIQGHPAVNAPDLQTDDPGYCLADSSINWTTSPGNEVLLDATDITVDTFGVGQL